MKNLKRLLANKNVVTILGAVLIVVILYAFYNWRVNQATSPVSVPYAKEEIPPRTRITDDMIDYVDVPQTALKGDVLRGREDVENRILGNYSNNNCVIPAGSFFYAGAVVSLDDLSDGFLVNIPDNTVAYNFSVNTMSTYGNAIYPGHYVDIYVKAKTDANKVMVGKLVQNVKVLAVKDGSGNNVFETSEQRTPAQIIFAVDDSTHTLLRTIEEISNCEVILVPTKVGLDDTTDEQEIVTEVTGEEIKSYIEQYVK